jgi:uncharacterized membrane protein YgcG
VKIARSKCFYEGILSMSDNIVQFRKKESPKAPKVKKPLSQSQYRLRIIAGIAAFLALSWCYFHFAG